MVTTDDIVKQLVDIYYTWEWWQDAPMEYIDAYNYHKKVYEQGNIQVYEENGKVLGYVESLKINYAQLGRIICKERFCADTEDINSGNICYLNNVWIHPEHRRGEVIKTLTRMFFARNFNCTHYVGHALRKSSQPLKVFKKEDLVSNLFRGGF